MKKLIILFLFVIVLLPFIAAKKTVVIKIGQKMTIYKAEDHGDSNYWGKKVEISQTETILPNDAYAKSLGIPEKEWEVFSKNVNGIYDSQLEELQKNYEKILEQKKSDYNNLFVKNTKATDLINILEISLAVMLLVICFLTFSLFKYSKRLKKHTFQQRLKSAMM
jgi:hypothetical protein